MSRFFIQPPRELLAAYSTISMFGQVNFKTAREHSQDMKHNLQVRTGFCWRCWMIRWIHTEMSGFPTRVCSLTDFVIALFKTVSTISTCPRLVYGVLCKLWRDSLDPSRIARCICCLNCLTVSLSPLSRLTSFVNWAISNQLFCLLFLGLPSSVKREQFWLPPDSKCSKDLARRCLATTKHAALWLLKWTEHMLPENGSVMSREQTWNLPRQIKISA